MSTITVIAAVYDTHALILYDNTGSTHEIDHGDPNIDLIVEKVLPVIEQGKTIEVDLGDVTGSLAPYADFSRKNTSKIGIFKVAKQFVSNLFSGSKPEEEANTPGYGTYGNIPNKVTVADNLEKIDNDTSPVEPVKEPEKTVTPAQKQANAIAEIRKNAKPVTKDEKPVTEEETLVAIIGNTVVPGMEQLANYFSSARSVKNYDGLQKLILRMAAIVDKRNHDILDLIKFLERGDLPITQNGDILAYKRLFKQGDHYVDPHSKKVTQKPGDFVCMAPEMVDPNRRNECSNGLHIGRRDYMRGFSGDTLCLVKLAPEDVIAVPAYDANKMRVCGYHILSVLSNDMAQKVYSRQAFADDTDGSRLLDRAVNGQFGAPKRIVQITAAQGGNLDIREAPENFLGMTVSELPEGVHGTTEARQVSGTKNVKLEQDKSTPLNVSNSTKTERVRKAFEKTKETRKKVEAKEQKKKATQEAKSSKPKTNIEVMQQHIANFLNASNKDKPEMARLAIRFKTTKKLSWGKLKVSDEHRNMLNTAAQQGKEQVKAVAKARNKPEPKAAKKPKTAKTPTTVRGTKKSINEEARELFNKGKFKDLMDLKRSKKKSLSALGFSEAEEKKITG